MSDWNDMTRRERILAITEDAVGHMSYYDRKGDEDLTVDGFVEAFQSGEVTVDEVVATFRAQLAKDVGYPDEVSLWTQQSQSGKTRNCKKARVFSSKALS